MVVVEFVGYFVVSFCTVVPHIEFLFLVVSTDLVVVGGL